MTLASVPAGVRRARVVVTFVDEPARALDPPPPQPSSSADGAKPKGKSFASLRGIFRGQFPADEEDFRQPSGTRPKRIWMSDVLVLDTHALVWFLQDDPRLGLPPTGG